MLHGGLITNYMCAENYQKLTTKILTTTIEMKILNGANIKGIEIIIIIIL